MIVVMLRSLRFLFTVFFLFFGFQIVAHAQSVVATVNGSPITSFDVEQRIRLAAITEQRRIDRKTALEELINDQVKVFEARRVGYRINEEGVDAEFNRFAQNNRKTEPEFRNALAQAGIETSIFRDKLRANLAWNVLMRDLQRRGGSVSNQELDSEIEKQKQNATKVTEYLLYQIVFVVTSENDGGKQSAAAQALRQRFQSCKTDLDHAKSLYNVALRDPMRRSSEDLPKPLADLFEKTAVGRLTPPQVSAEGIELVAICEKNVRNKAPEFRSSVASSLVEKKIQGEAKNYLAEIRKKIEIKYK